MLSALISSAHGYAALPLTEQLPHQKCVLLGPLVEKESSSFLRPQWIRTELSRRSEPSSRCFNRRTAGPLGPSPAPGCDGDIEVPNRLVDMNS